MCRSIVDLCLLAAQVYLVLDDHRGELVGERVKVLLGIVVVGSGAAT